MRRLLSTNRNFLLISVFSSLLIIIIASSLFFAADIRFAVTAATMAQKYQTAGKWALEIKNQPFSPTTTPLLPSDIEGLIPRLQSLAEICPQTIIVKKKLPISCSKITQATSLVSDLEPLIAGHLESSHTYLVLLQNSEELRASGGFMGSFARVTIGSRGIENLEIQDIYEPDGQFTGYVPAPPGVFEYLSSGNGLRLPDANWAADFPSAAQTILAYFSFGNESSVDGLAAINSSLLEKMLQITGDIYLPDYDTNISADTFTQLARSNRDEFFPGSKQKQHFLTALTTQLKIRYAELSPSQQSQLLNVVLDSINSKDTLFYSTNPQLQTFLSTNSATGTVSYLDQNVDAYLYLVESNVGINKANKEVERQVSVEMSDYIVNITLDFTNNNPTQPPMGSNDANLNYANYQRLLVPPAWQLHTISIDGKQVDNEQIDNNIITTSSGDQFRQIGFLQIVDAQTTSTSLIRFSKLAQNITATSQSIFLQKQPGQKPTPYQLKWRDIEKTIILDQNSTITIQDTN